MNQKRKYYRKTRRSNFKKKIDFKLYFCLFVFVSSLVYIGIYEVFSIKYVHGEQYEAKAIQNQVNKIQDKIINPNRGSILDRNQQALAISTTVYSIVLDVRVLVNEKEKVQQETIKGLNEALGIPLEELNENLKYTTEKNKDGSIKKIPVKDTNWLIIKKEVDYKTAKALQEKNLKCVYMEEDTKRSYPHNTMASQVIGFMRGDVVWGLESQYNDLMVGVPGRVFRTYEADNSIVTRQENPQTGYTLVTTLDQTIQQYAEDAAKKAYKEFNPEKTSIIVMNPNTGEILAMAEYPTFDLNNPKELSLFEDANYKANFDKLSEEEQGKIYNTVWKNFNIVDTFEPGSIFKPLVVAAGLEEGVITVNEKFYCTGQRVFGKDTIPCHKRSGHGTQSLDEVLANSCNIGMMDIVSKIGPEKFYKYQRDFGFGEKTGIDLPGEVTAFNLLYSLSQLNVTVQLATSSFGQGFNSTAIQSLNSFAAVINGGNLMKPYLVSQIVDKDGNIISENSPKVVRKVTSTATSDYLRNSMESVVETGTAKKGVIDGYKIGGKTGTGQQGDRKAGIYTLSFVAYLPVEKPEIIAMSVIHKPEKYADGVTSPVPMLREVLLNIINYKSIPPSKETTNDEIKFKSGDTDSILLNDYVGKSLKSTINELNNLGVEFEIAGGSGDTVTKTVPGGNSKISKSTRVLLYPSDSGQKELAPIPNLINLTIEQAQETLEANGFECVVEESAVVAEQSEDLVSEDDISAAPAKTEKSSKVVYEQYPLSDIKVEKGTIVKIKIN